VGIYIKGGITPIYSTPSFGPGQVGYIYTSVQTNTTTVAGQVTVLRTISNLAVGVYIVEGFVEQATLGGNTRYVSINLGSTELRYLSNYSGGGAAASGNGIDSVIVCFCTNASANNTLILSCYNNANGMATTSGLNAVRIA